MRLLVIGTREVGGGLKAALGRCGIPSSSRPDGSEDAREALALLLYDAEILDLGFADR